MKFYSQGVDEKPEDEDVRGRALFESPESYCYYRAGIDMVNRHNPEFAADGSQFFYPPEGWPGIIRA
ncbi:MAG: hypothetical protein ACPLRX_06330 [Candidatus Saccharicenans sp.]